MGEAAQQTKRQKSRKAYPKPNSRKRGNGKKQRFLDSGGDLRGEPKWEYRRCACGCGKVDWFDVRHGQKYVKGHGGKALMERRKERLEAMLRLAFIGAGATWEHAWKAAKTAIEMDFERAKLYMARQGWDYMQGSWVW